MYACLKNSLFQKKDYSIVSLRKEDIFKIKQWRNDQIDVLRQSRFLTDQDQLNYFENFVTPSFFEKNPKIILFSYLKENELIGYGGLTNNDWGNKRSEISFLLDTQRTGNDDIYGNDFFTFLDLMKEVAFSDMNFNRLFTETYDHRSFHISVLEKNGFRLEGRMKEHVFFNGKFVDSLIHGFLKSYYGV